MNDFLRTPNWFPVLGAHTFITMFMKLAPDEIAALAAGEESGEAAEKAIARLKPIMQSIPGHCFVSTDVCAPVDTERYELKRGAVYSARSAWQWLARSKKVQQAARDGFVTTVCIRPFRRMSPPREFRLFIKDRKLAAASQYHLIRHFRRLEGVKDQYWKLLDDSVNSISGNLQLKDVVMDVYVTRSRKVMIIDLNEFGLPTDPLLLKSWNINWYDVPEPKLKLMPPPFRISGEVKVSF